MRRILLATLLLTAAAAGGYGLLRDGDGERPPRPVPPAPPAPPAIPVAPVDPTPVDPAPVPRRVRGTGEIAGQVRRDGGPVPAVVLLHALEALPETNPLGIRPGAAHFDRILDGGIAMGEPVARTTTGADGADGAFTFADLDPGAYDVRAREAAGAWRSVTATIPAAGARVEVLFDLDTGGETLRGRVLEADGSAFRGWVLIERGERRRSLLSRAPREAAVALDGEGGFVMAGLANGPVQVSAVAPGSLRLVGAPVTLPHPETYVLSVPTGMRAIHGRVVDATDESPIAAAVVTAGTGDDRAGRVLKRTRANAEGRFTLSLSEGRGGLFATADGYAPYVREWKGDPEEALEVRMQPTAIVSGRVVRRDGGEGVAGTWVYAFPSISGPALFFPVAARSGAGGSFSLSGITPGTASVFALGTGWVTEGLLQAPSAGGYGPLAVILAPGEQATRTLEVVPAGVIGGSVRTADGRPIAGAVVTAETEVPLLERTRLLGVTGREAGSDVTDEEGRFFLPFAIPEAEYRLEIRAVGHPAHRSEALTVGSGRSTDVEITLPERVVDPDASPR